MTSTFWQHLLTISHAIKAHVGSHFTNPFRNLISFDFERGKFASDSILHRVDEADTEN